MKYLKYLPISLCVVGLLACTNKAQEQWGKTLKVHDEIMIKMQDNGDIESRLNELLLLANEDTTSAMHPYEDTLKAALNDLIAADNEMMDWMAHIKAPKKGMDMDSVYTALVEKEKEIIAVGAHMDNAANHAKTLLEQLGN